MPETGWVKGKLCGYLDIEEGKNCFNRKYFELDKESDSLNIYQDHPKRLPKLTCGPFEQIDLNCVSQVSDARKTRPKAGLCFSITIAGDQTYLVAESEDEMSTWINSLNEACRIIVPQTSSRTVAPPNARNVVAGGVIVNSQADDGSPPQFVPPAVSIPSIKSGYATKQGALRKNWKRRYFVLDKFRLLYFKGEMEREPIKTIPIHCILRARSVEREHHPHREYLFELETHDRTFNIQCETEKDCKKWVSEINALVVKKIEEGQTEIYPEQSMQSKSMPQPAIDIQRVAQRPPSQEEIDSNSRAVWV